MFISISYLTFTAGKNVNEIRAFAKSNIFIFILFILFINPSISHCYFSIKLFLFCSANLLFLYNNRFVQFSETSISSYILGFAENNYILKHGNDSQVFIFIVVDGLKSDQILGGILLPIRRSFG